MHRLLRVLAWVILAPAIVSTARASEETLQLRINYLAYPVDWNGKSIVIAGRFQAPLNVTGKIPAVIILHDTAGVKNNGTYYANSLNRAGIATFEIDQWGGRGLPGGASSRPKQPGDNLPDVAGAYRLLIARPEIDAARIGLLGFSIAPNDSRHVSLKVLPGATHIFDSLEGSYEFADSASHRRKGGTVHVRASPAAREEARDDLVRFFTAAFVER